MIPENKNIDAEAQRVNDQHEADKQFLEAHKEDIEQGTPIAKLQELYAMKLQAKYNLDVETTFARMTENLWNVLETGKPLYSVGKSNRQNYNFGERDVLTKKIIEAAATLAACNPNHPSEVEFAAGKVQHILIEILADLQNNKEKETK